MLHKRDGRLRCTCIGTWIVYAGGRAPEARSRESQKTGILYKILAFREINTIGLLKIGIGPYSRFPVGCTILLKTDSAAVVKVASDAAESMPSSSLAAYTVSGANIENAAYPSGICAERNALASAVFKGMRKGDARAIFVTTNMKAMCSPCGMCRQVIREFCEVGIMLGTGWCAEC